MRSRKNRSQSPRDAD